MLIRPILTRINQSRLQTVVAGSARSETCPGTKRKVAPICPSKGSFDACDKSGSPTGGSSGQALSRAEYSGSCRMGFIPEEWFLFLHSKTGVTGPYLLMFGLTNYLCSKEIFVMEHEYYTGCSIVILLYFISTRLGPEIGAVLDKEVDTVHADAQKIRDDEIAYHENILKETKLAQIRAEGQKELMVAKKENIALQLEAIYRERSMLVYNTVRKRLDYHVRRSAEENRIHHKWMYQWIMDNIYKSITTDFKKQALHNAIAELATISQRVK